MRRCRRAGPPPDALSLRPCRASGCRADRRVPRTLSLGAGPLGAGPAVLVQGPAGLRYLAGDHAFGLEEAGDYTRAEDESRAAAELEPFSFWPHHTVAHVMEMTGRPEDGMGWMTAREPLWSTPGHMNQVHIWWHKALFHLELGQYDAALALYH